MRVEERALVGKQLITSEESNQRHRLPVRLKKAITTYKEVMPTVSTQKETQQLKVQKLRNAEYYDNQDITDRLYAKATRKENFHNLMSIISSSKNIRLAYRNIKKNSGSRTAGTDNRTIKYLERMTDEDLILIIQKKLARYNPQKVKRVEIPKEDGKLRPLGIPAITDRLIQQCILQVLEPIAEAHFHNRSNGFRPDRSGEHAVAQMYVMAQKWGLHYVVDIDIKGFFDNVNHGKLLKQLWSLGIRDKKLISIISAMLKAEVAGIGFPEKGTPQGGIISPLLANIVLNEFDWWIDSQWENIPTSFPYKPTSQKSNGTFSMNNRNIALRKSSNLKEIYVIRYADDLKLMCRHYNDAIRIYHASKMWLKERLGLDINEQKSQVVNLKEKSSGFLGFKIKLTSKGLKSDGTKKYTISSHIADKNMKKIRTKVVQLIHEIGYPDNERKRRDALWMYNSYVMGIHNYYRLATNVNIDLHKIAHSLRATIKSKLGYILKRDGTTGSKFITQKYGASAELRYIGKNAMIPIGYCQTKAPMQKSVKVNRFTPEGRKLIHKKLEGININTLHYLMNNPVKGETIEFNDNRISLYSGQSGKCFITGKPLMIGNMHVHHKSPVLGDGYSNLTFITGDAHRLIHAVKLEIINKYMNVVKPNPQQLDKINKLRELLNIDLIAV